MKDCGLNLDGIRTMKQWTNWPHVIETQQFSAEILDTMMYYIVRVENRWAQGLEVPRLSDPSFTSKRVILFHADEASTRTRGTFSQVARRLGYIWEDTLGPFSSVSKGESPYYSTMALTQVGGMGTDRGCDVFVYRSKIEGAAQQAVEAINDANLDGCKRLPLPVINAGDGANQHPTQGLVDLATIYRERRWRWMNDTGYACSHPLDDITVSMIGDISHSRTIRSLCYLLGKFSPEHSIRIIFCSHPSLFPHEGILEYLKEQEVHVEIWSSFEDTIRVSDVNYMTRIQRERPRVGGKLSPFDRAKYAFREEHLKLLKHDAFVIHPLPINEDPDDPPPEIDPALRKLAVSGDPRCAWGRQSHRGKIVRYVLLDTIEYGIQQIARTN